MPKEWLDIHTEIIDILFRLSADYYSISEYNSDPMRALIAINEVKSVIDPQIKSLLQRTNKRISENSLVPASSFYEILRLLYQ